MTEQPKIRFKVTDDQLEELIHRYCRDFTQWARMGRFDPITGRDEQIDQSILIILQKGRKNVALLAPAGVGKTALCAGLAQKIVANQVPEYLKNARVLEIDLAAMAAGTSGPAEFQARFPASLQRSRRAVSRSGLSQIHSLSR
jgi:ATP-dependent Clp protease ATP-binding subunit ClpA